jgi:hypothetical protein
MNVHSSRRRPVPLTIKEHLIAVMAAYFGDDARRIDHAKKVTAAAELIMAGEGGDYDVVIGAGVLHDIGIHEAERKHGSAAGNFQEIEGPPIARKLLTELGFDPAKTDEICDIIAHHHSPGVITTVNFKVLYDADWTVQAGRYHRPRLPNRDRQEARPPALPGRAVVTFLNS